MCLGTFSRLRRSLATYNCTSQCNPARRAFYMIGKFNEVSYNKYWLTTVKNNQL